LACSRFCWVFFSCNFDPFSDEVLFDWGDAWDPPWTVDSGFALASALAASPGFDPAVEVTAGAGTSCTKVTGTLRCAIRFTV
jgi:hypothetical protein